jgi:DNA-binding response OmpR family regulator
LLLVAMDDPSTVVEDVIAVRDVTAVPLIILAEPPTEERMIAALQGGADLVLVRPVAPRLLAAYVQVQLRRFGTAPAFILPSLDLAEVVLDPATRTIEVKGQEPRRLTQLEFRLLYVLMTNRGQVIPTDQIVERVWGYSGDGDRELVRGLISRLRRKMEPNPDKPRYIETVPGIGYRFSFEEGLPDSPAPPPTSPGA